MAGGWGSFPWGDGPWGGGEPLEEGYITDIYQVPFGVELGGIYVNMFSGEPASGILSGTSGAVFFSPALLAPSAGNEIDLDEINVTAYASDVYDKPSGSLNRRNFRWGPNPGSKSKTNGHWVTAPKEYTAIGVMVQTIPPGPTTIYRVP
jgi:hypothetical protein